ncbi:hypothetical protein ACWA1C_20120 [Flectobacillus roseus]
MYYVLNKDIIESEIICHLPVRKRGFKPQAPTCEIINYILYKLETGNHVMVLNGIYYLWRVYSVLIIPTFGFTIGKVGKE